MPANRPRLAEAGGRPELDLALAYQSMGASWPKPLGGCYHVAQCVEVECGVDAGQHPLEVDVGVALDAGRVCRVFGAAADLTGLLLQGVEDATHLSRVSRAIVS